MFKVIIIFFLFKFTSVFALSELDIQSFKNLFQELNLPFNNYNVEVLGDTLAHENSINSLSFLLFYDHDYSNAQNLNPETEKEEFYAKNNYTDLSLLFDNYLSYQQNIIGISRKDALKTLLRKFSFFSEEENEKNKVFEFNFPSKKNLDEQDIDSRNEIITQKEIKAFAKLKSDASSYFNNLKILYYNSNTENLTLRKISDLFDELYYRRDALKKLFFTLAEKNGINYNFEKEKYSINDYDIQGNLKFNLNKNDYNKIFKNLGYKLEYIEDNKFLEEKSRNENSDLDKAMYSYY